MKGGVTTDEQFRRLLLMLNAIRIAFLAALPTDEMGVTRDEREASDVHAAAALAPIVDAGATPSLHR